jgi:hypothetical protein
VDADGSWVGAEVGDGGACVGALVGAGAQAHINSIPVKNNESEYTSDIGWRGGVRNCLINMPFLLYE